MKKAISFAVLSAGIVLAFFGIRAMNSPSSNLSRLFTGAPTDKAMEMLIGGILAVIAGVVGLSSSRR